MVHPELYRGWCIINGTSYKISSGNTLIDGTSKKIEFGAPKTWSLGDLNITDISEFDTDGDDKLSFKVNFYAPHVNDYSYFGATPGENNFSWLKMYYRNWTDGFCITYVMKSKSGDYEGTSCNVYKAGGAHWSVFNGASRIITFYESPTGTLLSLLQKTSTPIY